MKVKTVNMIEVSDWDRLVSKAYGRPYNFQQQDDCKLRGVFQFTCPVVCPEDFESKTVPEVINDPMMGVSFEAWLARSPKESIKGEEAWGVEMWWERNFYPHVEMVINDLHSRGLLEAGQYGINIDW